MICFKNNSIVFTGTKTEENLARLTPQVQFLIALVDPSLPVVFGPELLHWLANSTTVSL